ncbi:MAG: cupin domain-containing protein [Polyangiaceae bacterium]
MHPDTEALIRELGLAPHPEGGHYRETFRSSQQLNITAERVRAASTAIYFLLPVGVFSALHKVSSDEVWHHYDGAPVELHMLTEAGHHEKVILGRDLSSGQRPQHVVPAGVWQAAVPLGGLYPHALCGCTVAPGFDFADFEMPSRAELVKRFPAHIAMIQSLTRE